MKLTGKRLPAVVMTAAMMAAWGIEGVMAAQQGQAGDEELQRLQQQIDLLQQQLDRMQQELERLTGTTEVADSDAEGEESPVGERPDSSEPDALAEIQQRLVSLEDAQQELAPDIAFGGAVRLNYAWRDFDEINKDRGGDFELELFRINTDGEIGNVILSAEWRRYNDFQAIHHAWVGYNFSEKLQGQIGISQVPFGLLPFASHSFWFGGTYYLGFEDDYDTGIKFIHKPDDRWTFHYAFYKNPEYANDGRFGRYSFDLVTDGDQQNSEINQLNLRAERHLEFAGGQTLDVGVSLQGGQIFNSITRRKGERYAVAAHANAFVGPWNFQLQGIRYEFNPDNPDFVDDNFVQTGAFEFPFLMAAKGEVLTANVARSFTTSFGPITGVTCYNDFTFINPTVDNSADSIQNVTGCSVSAGGVFAYFDYILGKNMWFAGGDGIGRNATTAGDWKSRVNINIGYYF